MIEYKVGQKFKVTNDNSMYIVKLGEIVEVILVDPSDQSLPVMVSNGKRSEWAYPGALSPLSNLSFADLVGGIADGSIAHGTKFEQIGGAHYKLEVLNGSLVCALSKGTILTTRETLEAEYVLVEAKKAEPKFKYVMDKEVYLIISKQRTEFKPDVEDYTLIVNPFNLGEFGISRFVGSWKSEFTNKEFDSLKLPYKLVKLLDKVEVKQMELKYEVGDMVILTEKSDYNHTKWDTLVITEVDEDDPEYPYYCWSPANLSEDWVSEEHLMSINPSESLQSLN